MTLPRRTLLIVLGSIVALILLIALAIPLFLNADAFRTRIETALTNSLGRKVTMGKLDLSVLTGNLVAENGRSAIDQLNTRPFDLVDSDARMPDLLADRDELHTPVGADPASDQRVAMWLNAVRAKVRTGVTAPSVGAAVVFIAPFGEILHLFHPPQRGMEQVGVQLR